MARERREAVARSEGQKLTVSEPASGWEMSCEWDGPPGAHRAVIHEEHQNHPFGHEYTLRIDVYDADGKLLGCVSKHEWS